MLRYEWFAGRSYEEARRAFRWQIPAAYNIGLDACARWAQDAPDRVAIVYESDAGARATVTYGALRAEAARLANALRAHGVDRGDRVAVILHQRPETASAHIAIYTLGAVAVPLTRQFGPDALAYRLAHSGCRAAIADPTVVPVLAALHDQTPDLRLVVVVHDARLPELPEGGRVGACRYVPWSRLLEPAASTFAAEPTGPDDPALIIYTSGTTGPPKGAIHGHRVLLGHLPSVQLYFDFVPQGGEVYWTPADWAWIGGAYDLLFPALWFGGPVVAFETTKFDPERAFRLMAAYGVTHAFLPPTALKMCMQVAPPAGALRLRAVMSGGEPVNPVILEWRDRHLPGVVLHEIYGQTEANLVCGNCSRLYPVRPGSLGKAFPGHEVIVLRDDGTPAAPGEPGEIAVRGPGDPVVFLGYWQHPQATAEKYHGEWLRTGDVARCDDDGYFYFEGRTDDVIKSGAYRIGPAEVESSLLTHPAVAECAVIGVPDPVRGQIVKAFVKLRPGYAPSPDQAGAIQQHVKTRLAAYAYPREVEFLDALPMTTTGKIRRAELRAREMARRGLPGAG
ncbi:MAG: AMP-binding protein [Armatimonadota bacterium]|nr:AMP-binding protein [Armatimonadota bacterium]MDR7531809.1 AMP-binding protein [Armatimonadota bacterium]MDR7534846.1 AMP-binding protein [Armatimonadota bacterium]